MYVIQVFHAGPTSLYHVATETYCSRLLMLRPQCFHQTQRVLQIPRNYTLHTQNHQQSIEKSESDETTAETID